MSNLLLNDRDVLEYLRKESVDIYNRLHSIVEDAAFVEHISHNVYPDMPLIPNLRCGAWYSDPAIVNYRDTPAYFKSTDGHFGNWSFNLRRANLHLVSLVAEHNGVILVDSTRSGKRIPDALSKTVPIWCAVINRTMVRRYPDSMPSSWDTALYTPPGAVSEQEHHQIEKRIDAWADALHNSSFHLPNLSHPLRPLWITPATTVFPSICRPCTFLPVICLSASKQVHLGTERRTEGFSYIQGSGDDHELWSMGLTPDMFWEHHAGLLAATRSELPTLVHDITKARNAVGSREGPAPTPIARVDGRLLLCALSDLASRNLEEESTKDDSIAYVLITPKELDSSPNAQGDGKLTTQGNSHDATNHLPSKAFLHLTHHSPGTKKGQSQFLSHILPASYAFISAHLSRSKRNRVCVACENGRDVSVGVVLAVLGRIFDENGAFLAHDGSEAGGPIAQHEIDKKTLRTRLEWIIASRPVANPARATLKRVNEFLITPERLQGLALSL